MSLTLYNSIGWAVEKQTIAAGGGLTGPVLVSASSTDPNTVRLTFDRKLMLEYRQWGVYRAKTLDLDSFQIIKVADSTPLTVVRTVWVDDTHIDLLTNNQEVSIYRVTAVAGGVMDFWGNTISLQTADFTGQERATYTTPNRTHAFTSGYGGMQADESPEVYPDLEPPYLASLDPARNAPNISRYTNILFDLLDTNKGVDLSTVRIWVGGTLAYRGDTDTFLAPYNGPSSARTVVPTGHRFVIDSTVVYPTYTLIQVIVDAYDLAPIPNHLVDLYSFRTLDDVAPTFGYRYPSPGDINIPRTASVTLEIVDAETGVLASSVQLRVNGTLAWASDTSQPGFSVVKTTITNGYRYVITPDINFGSYETVSIAAYAADNAPIPNILNTTYSFRTVDTVAPYFSYRHPTEGDIGVPVWHEVSVTVVDAGSGVNAASVLIVIDGETAWVSDTIQSGFTGTKTVVAGGFAYVISKVIPFTADHDVTVSVSCTDVSGNVFSSSYTFHTEVGAAPVIFDVFPVPNQINVPASSTIHCTITDAILDLDPTSVVFIVNEVLAYATETARNFYTVTRTPILGGYLYEVTPPAPFTWSSTVSVFIYCRDYSAAVASLSYTFDVELAPTCFTGPLTDFEELVIQPFDATYPYLEMMRSGLIESFVKINPLAATRAVYIQGQAHDLSIVLRDLVPTLTEEQRAVTVCKRRPLLTVASLLPQKHTWLEGSLDELTALGVTAEHRRLIESYIDPSDDLQSVNLMCFIVLLAKSLES